MPLGVTDQYLKQAEILAAKHALFDLCLTGAVVLRLFP